MLRNPANEAHVECILLSKRLYLPLVYEIQRVQWLQGADVPNLLGVPYLKESNKTFHEGEAHTSIIPAMKTGCGVCERR